MRVALLALLIACKADESPAPPSPVPSSDRPRLETVTLPTVDGAKVLQSKVRGDGHAMAVWCFDQADAVERVKAALSRDGWTDVKTRGKDEGIAASKGEVRLSARVTKGDPRCAGTLVSATVLHLGKIDMQLKAGEKIR